jgi:hypothetical protein
MNLKLRRRMRKLARAIGIELNGKAYAPIHDISGNLAALIPLDGVWEGLPRSERFASIGLCLARAQNQSFMPTTVYTCSTSKPPKKIELKFSEIE